MEFFGPLVREFAEGKTCRLGTANCFIINICEITHVLDGETIDLKDTPKSIL
jgi:hypothetical protein